MINKKYSIVIPSFNHCNDLLIPCINSIIKYSNLDEVEICISANGCTDNTENYLKELSKQYPNNIKYHFDPNPLGYSKATNIGIKLAAGKYIVLLNNDCIILESNKNEWLERLESPFTNPTVGISGIHFIHSRITNRPFLVFFVVMILKTVFDEIGLLDEDFGIGGGEDTEFCWRME